MILTLVAGCGVDPGLPYDSTTNDPVDPCEVPGNICTWLGVQPERVGFFEEGVDRLSVPSYAVDIAFLTDGTAFYADLIYNRIRMVSPDGIVTTLSGTGAYGDGPPGTWENDWTTDCWGGCPALESAWAYPSDVVPDPKDPDVVWVAAWQNSRINRIDRHLDTMTWWAGTGGRFFADGPREQAMFNRPTSIAVAPNGMLYISDPENHLIRRLTPENVVQTVAGEPRMPGYDGDGGSALEAHLHGMGSRKADPVSRLTIAGNLLLIADYHNGVIRSIDLNTCDVPDGPIDEELPTGRLPTCVIEHFAGRYESAGTSEFYDWTAGEYITTDAGSVGGYSGDGGDADEAVFNRPSDVAVGAHGEVYVADSGNHCVRVIHPDHTIETFAGQCTVWGFEGDGGPATGALLSHPWGVATDAEGNVYVADTSNHVIRRIVPLP